jgi:uncharacterized protein (UPF0548 family)
VGASRQTAPKGYTVDHNRIALGKGPEVFQRAKCAVNAWRMFDMPWLKLCWPDASIVAGTTVGVLGSHLKFWSLNFCRIAYVVDEHGPIETFGFAYGTLPQHAEIGEERFTVEFNSQDQNVSYDIYAFSRPRLLPLVAYPFTRSLQKRFARDSMQAMLKSVS